MNQSDIIQEKKRLIYYFLKRNYLNIKRKVIKVNQNPKFLFILSPPYCGSTLLNQLLSTSKNVSCNNELGTREGQLLPGVKHFMFQKNRWSKEVKYDWEIIKNVWMKYWDQSKPILLDKSIPNIMRVEEIKKVFTNTYFICMVRNPYAQIEGIMRRNNTTAEYATDFTLKCLHYQRENIEREKNILFFTYEELCEKEEQTIEKISKFLPEIKDIKANSKFKAHNFKTKSAMQIVNLNNEKISKIDKTHLSIINQILLKEKELLDYFNYNIIY